MQTIKGMVQVSGTTYRVVRIARGLYEVIRISNDETVGRFSCSQGLQVAETRIAAAEMRAIACAAVRAGKTTWSGPRNVCT